MGDVGSKKEKVGGTARWKVREGVYLSTQLFGARFKIKVGAPGEVVSLFNPGLYLSNYLSLIFQYIHRDFPAPSLTLSLSLSPKPVYPTPCCDEIHPLRHGPPALPGSHRWKVSAAAVSRASIE